MPGGGWKSMDFTNNQIPSSGQLDTQQRRFGDQLSRWFLRLLHGDTDPAAAGRTIGGWAATNVVGQLQATVTRGSGYHVDAALFGSDSALSVGETEDTTTLNFSAGPAPGNERIDVIACTMSQASGQNITVLQFGGGTLAQNFEFGGVATLAVVEGTPAAIGAAVAPAMGSGQQALWEVLVPASAADRKSTRLNSSHSQQSRMPSSA